MAAVPDAEVAGALFRQYERGLYRFCLSRLRSREDAEDAVQTTFVRAVRALERGVRPDVAPAWLFTIARNVCSSRRLAALRRARVETPRDLDRVPAAALARDDERPDELIGLRDALAEMPPKLQRVVLLREWQGLSYGEIGAELGVSQSAVETLLYRARRDLARRLRGLLDLGPLFGIKALLGGATVAAVAVATLDPGSISRPSPAPLARIAVAVPHARTLRTSRVLSVRRRAAVVHLPRVSAHVVVPIAPRAAPRAPRRASRPSGVVAPSVRRPTPIPTSASVVPPPPPPAPVAMPAAAEPTAGPPPPVAADPPPQKAAVSTPTSTVVVPVDQTAPTVTAPVEQAASTVTAPVEQTAAAVTAPVAQTASTVTTPVEQTTSTVTTSVAQTTSTVAAAVPPAPALPPPPDPSTLLPGG
jgi:RNA polymerase sigma-70 factor (ECF subfamily)